MRSAVAGREVIYRQRSQRKGRGSVERPTQTVRGRNQSGLTWFSDIEPGTYRVKDIRLDEERGDVTYRLPQVGLAEPVLSFTIDAGELRYLGYIEIMPQNDQVLDPAVSVKLTNVLHFNIRAQP